MLYRLAADITLLVHFGFILFAALGVLSVVKWTRMAWLHIPAVAWAAYIMFSGKICPLTPLENWFRQQAGQEGYTAGFIEHYIWPLIYPDNLTRDMQIVIGLFVLSLNLIFYGLILYRKYRKNRLTTGS